MELGNFKNAWDSWLLSGSMLISIIIQIAHSLLGSIRKYNSGTPVRVGLWFTSLLINSVPLTTLSLIAQIASRSVAQPHIPNTSELMFVWAPFILLYSGGPDTITAYSLEDNELWLRHMVDFVFRSALALYILLLSWPGCSHLLLLTLLAYAAAFIKCYERVQALWLASTKYLRKSMLARPGPGPNYFKFVNEIRQEKSQGFTYNPVQLSDTVPKSPIRPKGFGVGFLMMVEYFFMDYLSGYDHSYSEGKQISKAYNLFQTFKRLFVDLIIPPDNIVASKFYFHHLKSAEAFRIVETELGFAHDMLYTKANVVYTSTGLLRRLLSFIFLVMVPLIYCYHCDIDGYPFIDVVITYLLVGTTFLMEIIAVITMLCSDWTDLWLNARNLTRNILVFPFLKHPAKRRWSGSIGQFDLLSVAIDEKPANRSKIQKFLGLDFICVKHRYKTYSKVSEDLKEFIYCQFSEYMVYNSDPKELRSHYGSLSLRNNKCDALLWSTTEVEFDQSILIWHIATSLCYYSELENEDDGYTYACRTESKHISDYLLYLLVSYPGMLPIGIGMIRYRDTCAEATRFFNEKGFVTEKVEAFRKLLEVDCLEVLPSKVKEDRCKSVLFDGCRLASTLKKMERERIWRVISQVWIDFLAYAATHCRGFDHMQHLVKGGELLTHVWLLMTHLGITKQFQEFQGHSRAK